MVDTAATPLFNEKCCRNATVYYKYSENGWIYSLSTTFLFGISANIILKFWQNQLAVPSSIGGEVHRYLLPLSDKRRSNAFKFYWLVREAYTSSRASMHRRLGYARWKIHRCFVACRAPWIDCGGDDLCGSRLWKKSISSGSQASEDGRGLHCHWHISSSE